MKSGRDERGSALVSVLVVMLVLTLSALTLATVVTNTSSTLVGGRSASQARAAADAGIAAALAAFTKAEKCIATITSETAPKFDATCTADTSSVTFVSTGIAVDGHKIKVQAVYGYTLAQAFEPKVGQLSFFSRTDTYEPNKVTSTTSGPAKVIVADGDFYCDSAMTANVVVQYTFIAENGCHVSGWVKAKVDAILYANSSVGGDLTAGRNAVLYSPSSVGGSLVAGGYADMNANSSVGGDVTAVGTATLRSPSWVAGKLTSGGSARLESYSTVGGDLTTGGSADLATGTSVGGNLTSTDYSDVEGVVKGNLVAGRYVDTWYASSITGWVTAAGIDRTEIRGSVGKDVTAVGPVTTYDGSVVKGSIIAVGTSLSEVRGTVTGSVAAGGAVRVDGSVAGDLTAAGTATTSVYGSVVGNIKAKGPVYVDYNNTVSGDVTSAGTGTTSVYGRVVGNVKVAGTVTLTTSGSVGASVTSAGTGTNSISGSVTGNLVTGGDVYLPAGSIGGNLTLPSAKSLTPAGATSRVAGVVIRQAGPAAPGAPSAPTASLTVPQVTVIAPASPTIPTWLDYGYSSADWPGYAVRAAGSWCSDRNWATYLASFTKPTVVDGTGCTWGLNQYPSSMTSVVIQTNIVVVSSEIDLKYVKFSAKAGTTPNLWFIVPSSRGSVKHIPWVTFGSGEINLDSTTLDVPTMLYTPENIVYRYSTFTGSMYAGRIGFDSGPPGSINAAPLEFPIAVFEQTASTTPATFSVTAISQREVA